MINRAKIRRTNDEWMNLIGECKSGGLSDQVWLKQKQIPASSYYKKYRELCGEAEYNAPFTVKHLTEVP